MIDRLPISILLLITFLVSFSLLSEEMIIGRESISPGIDIVFEAAPKDIVFPLDSFLSESETNIHIEMLANWSEDAPEGSPVGGFIAYLDVFAIISNDLGDNLKVNLSPHLNLSDNFHYAQNIKLPGSIDDTYVSLSNIVSELIKKNIIPIIIDPSDVPRKPYLNPSII